MIFDFRKVQNEKRPITIKGSQVELCKSYKYLGVTVQDNLKWDIQTDNMCSKASQRLYLLSCLRRAGMSDKDLVKYYMSVVRSVVEQSCPVWHAGLTVEQSNQIELIQKRALKIIYHNLGYEEALVKANLTTLKVRRDILCKALFNEIKEEDHY